jgi:hypothetical protein
MIGSTGIITMFPVHTFTVDDQEVYMTLEYLRILNYGNMVIMPVEPII